VNYLFEFNRADFDFVAFNRLKFNFMRNWGSDDENEKNTSADGESGNFARTFLWEKFKC
jgi:hypothetical protein